MNKLLLIVDPQVDFITGSLPVEGAAKAMDALATYVKEQSEEYSVKIVTANCQQPAGAEGIAHG